MIFKRKKRKSVLMKHVPLPVLIRQTIYDTMLEPAEGIAEAMGLPPISDDVADMEADASQERLESIASLLPFIDSHSDMAARISAAAYALDDDDGEDDLASLNLDSENIEALTSLFKIVALSSSISCISSLVELGLVESKVDSYGK
ncbi:hypothetical protein UFOVP27_62 [uncultured Caudovirales phage]|uniref:Uncharacterized protein n=1 Tax=uncultured Caudovirales phage TaxID=2100421 RepID=A0A6J5KJ21_9CAUD|nr:hypothetical protein UFOVP27_62 [uncultured Caudovirales phage]